MSLNIVLDHAGSLTYVTDAPSLSEAMEAASRNPNIPSVNVSWVETHTLEKLEESSPYPVTEIAYSELESYNRAGCQFDECHNLAEGRNYRSANYCDEHAGPVTDEYAYVTVTWEGAVNSHDTCYNREEILKIVADTEAAVTEARKEGTFNEEYGVKVEASFHTHEFDTREQYDDYDGDCFCESYDTEYDSSKDEPGENGLPEVHA